KLLKMMMISITLLLVIGIIVGFIFFKQSKEVEGNDQQTIDEMNDLSYETPEITTDLKDDRFVRIQFLIVTDSKGALKEIEKREFQIKNILIKEISLMSEEDFSTGLSELEKTLMDRLNDVMLD